MPKPFNNIDPQRILSTELKNIWDEINRLKSLSFNIDKGLFGVIYVSNDSASAQSIPTGTSWTKSTAFENNGGQYSFITPDASNDQAIIQLPGIYYAFGNVSAIPGTAGVTWQFTVAKDGAAGPTSKIYMGTVSKHHYCHMSGFFTVTAKDTIADLRVRHDNGGSIDLTITHANIGLFYLGKYV